MLKTILMPEFQISQFSLSNKKKKITLQVKLLKTLLTFFFLSQSPTCTAIIRFANVSFLF